MENRGRIGRIADDHEIGMLGTSAPARSYGGASTTCRSATPAADNAASGSVNDGAISAAIVGARLASSAKPSAAPASSATSSRRRPCLAATASIARCSSTALG